MKSLYLVISEKLKLSNPKNIDIEYLNFYKEDLSKLSGRFFRVKLSNALRELFTEHDIKLVNRGERVLIHLWDDYYLQISWYESKFGDDLLYICLRYKKEEYRGVKSIRYTVNDKNDIYDVFKNLWIKFFDDQLFGMQPFISDYKYNDFTNTVIHKDDDFKDIYEINISTMIKECDCYATPMNTTGLGNPSGPDSNGIASEPLIVGGKPRKLTLSKRKKQLKNITEKLRLNDAKYFPETKEELKQLIEKCIEKEGPECDLNNIDTAKITDMSELFKNMKDFNGDISNWDVSNVTNMKEMFFNCESFNQPLNAWNVSNVENMERMFYRCNSFNKDISNWDISKVTDIHGMFAHCKSFNQPLNNWDVSKVKNMEGVFFVCESFNQPLNNWNVSNVTTMQAMFDDCKSFNQPLNNWDVSNVKNMSTMFSGCGSFNQPLDKWDVSNVIGMYSMFYECESFNQDISNWDVSNVKYMDNMFYGCQIQRKYRPFK